jgi:spore germination cell wall hydrolase CwlJ-like protein
MKNQFSHPVIKVTLMLLFLFALMVLAEWIAPSHASQIDTKPPRYYITQAEREEIERVVMAEAGGECWEGQLAVAWCILNAAEKERMRPTEILTEYKYTSNRKDPSDSVREAVASAFDRGEEICREQILYFYAPALVSSEWHESQEFVVEIENHRFFKEAQ